MDKSKQKLVVIIILIVFFLGACYSISKYLMSDKVNNYLASTNKLTGWQKKDGYWYFYGNDGKLRTGWKNITVKKVKNTYYFNSQGQMQVGLKLISGKYYFFNASGILQKDVCKYVNNIKYCFNKSGKGVVSNNTKKYNKLTSLGTIVVSNKIIAVPDVGECNKPNGFTVAGNYLIATKTQEGNVKTCLTIYDKNTYKKVKNINSTIFGHANDLAYNSKTDYVYVVQTNSEYKYSRKFKLSDFISDSSTAKKENELFYNEKGNKQHMHSVAYDKSNDMMYTAMHKNVYVYDNTKKLQNHFLKLKQDDGSYGTTQGIEAYKGKILVIRNNGYKKYDDNVGTTTNSIDIYRNNGDYLGSYIIVRDSKNVTQGSELEGIAYSGTGNKFYFYFNHNGEIYEANLNIPE